MRINLYVPDEDVEAFKATQQLIIASGRTLSGVVMALLKADAAWPKLDSAVRRSAPPMAAQREDGRLCGCGHLERQHSNTGVSSGAGCGYGVCACRRFTPAEE